MADSRPARGRPRRPEGIKRLKLRESTYNLWIERKEALGLHGITNNDFAEMLLHQQLIRERGCFLVLRKLLFVSFCVVVWVLFSVFSIFCITSLVSATPRNHPGKVCTQRRVPSTVPEYSGTDTMPEFLRIYRNNKKGVFTLVLSEFGTRALCLNTKCEHYQRCPGVGFYTCPNLQLPISISLTLCK